MSKFKYSDEERQFNNILVYQTRELSLIKRHDKTGVEARISESEELLKELIVIQKLMLMAYLLTIIDYYLLDMTHFLV